MLMLRRNPCLRCGACCAYFRVSFYWSESDPELGGLVPVELVEDISPFVRAMKGTNQLKPHCAALIGQVREAVQCSIYEARSSACRDFGIHWSEDGIMFSSPEDLNRCNRARASWQLPPLFQNVPRAAVSRPVLHRHKHHRAGYHPPFHLHHVAHSYRIIPAL